MENIQRSLSLSELMLRDLVNSTIPNNYIAIILRNLEPPIDKYASFLLSTSRTAGANTALLCSSNGFAFTPLPQHAATDQTPPPALRWPSNSSPNLTCLGLLPGREAVWQYRLMWMKIWRDPCLRETRTDLFYWPDWTLTDPAVMCVTWPRWCCSTGLRLPLSCSPVSSILIKETMNQCPISCAAETSKSNWNKWNK